MEWFLKAIISHEYLSEWKPGDEPYYPANDEKNAKLYAAYKQLADKESKVIFGGRLGEYKYYDMDQVIAAALERCRMEFELRRVTKLSERVPLQGALLNCNKFLR